MNPASEITSAEMRNFLTRRLGEKEAAEVMGYIDTAIEKEVTQKTDNLRTEITAWRNDLKNVFATKEDDLKLQTRLLKRVSSAEGTLILWSFVFWLTQLVAILCFIKFFK
ncbi:MAG: hypothetical protein ABJA57_13535 [Ginsengibacter sp.]